MQSAQARLWFDDSMMHMKHVKTFKNKVQVILSHFYHFSARAANSHRGGTKVSVLPFHKLGYQVCV